MGFQKLPKGTDPARVSLVEVNELGDGIGDLRATLAGLAPIFRFLWLCKPPIKIILGVASLAFFVPD